MRRVLSQIERLVGLDWGRAATAPGDLARKLCEGVVSRLAEAVSEFVSDLAAHLEREEECVVSAENRGVGGLPPRDRVPPLPSSLPRTTPRRSPRCSLSSRTPRRVSSVASAVDPSASRPTRSRRSRPRASFRSDAARPCRRAAAAATSGAAAAARTSLSVTWRPFVSERYACSLRVLLKG